MRRQTYELYYALVAVTVISVIYVPVAIQSVPRASGLLGHGMGIVGFLMMLSTETLYSLRKRARGRAIGRLSTWLQIHIFTGIVGPYMVLLHSAWKFNGLAGVLMLMTVIVVASGFVGRYIYTAVPRTADGAEITIRDLENQIAVADSQLQSLGVNRLVPAAAFATIPSVPQDGLALVFGRGLAQWQYQRRVRNALRQLDAAGRPQATQLQKLLDQRYRVQRQLQSLAMARRLLAVWHTVHIPLGIAMFAVAFVHIGAALYYATFLK